MTHTGALQRHVVAFVLGIHPGVVLPCLLLGGGATAFAHTETLTVDDDGPADYATIQEAVEAASPGDIIQVHPGTYSRTGDAGPVVNVDSVQLDNFREGGSLTIEGIGGRDETFIDGGFERRGVVWKGINGVLRGFTIQKCKQQQSAGFGVFDAGGGMYIKDASPMVTDCVFTLNEAPHAGGGLAIEGTSSSILKDCVFLENTVPSGNLGAGCALVRIEPTNRDGPDGGAIRLEGVEFTENNPASQEGVRQTGIGGIGLYAFETNLVMSGCLFESNQGREDDVNDGSSGGGAKLSQCTGRLERCSFRHNKAEMGGGLFIEGGTLEIIECIIEQNAGGDSGGGLSVDIDDSEDSTLIRLTYIGENVADSLGGGTYFTVQASTTGDDDASVKVDRCVFKDNHAGELGGGVHLNAFSDSLDNAASLNFRGCSFIGNSAEQQGGGIGTEASSNNESLRLTVAFCLFACNEAGTDPVDPNQHGGAAFIGESVEGITFAQCLVYANEAKNGSGGGIVMDLAPRFESSICNSRFELNEAMALDQELECSGCENGTNGVGKGCGGGLFVDSTAWTCDEDADAPVTYTCNSFKDNHAVVCGTEDFRIPGSLTNECCEEVPAKSCDGRWETAPPRDDDPLDPIDCDQLNPLRCLFESCPLGQQCPADLNCDGIVDGADLSILLGFWGELPVPPYPTTCDAQLNEVVDIDFAPLHTAACYGSALGCCALEINADWLAAALPGDCVTADINGDGVVDGADLSTLLGLWGACE